MAGVEETGHSAVLVFQSICLGLRTADRRLIGIDLLGADQRPSPPTDPFTRRVQSLLEAYRQDAQSPLDLPLFESGTPFQCRVWSALRAIPLGQAMSYADLAEALGSSPRAVAQACRANPVPVVTPCHRVVSRQGLGGYAGRHQGPMLEFKAWLLRHEGVSGFG